MNPLADRLVALIEPTAAALGYDVVRVQVDGKRAQRVQIMAERRDGGGMTIDDCTALSRAVAAAFDAADPIESAYQLEVSSPGIDRPLVRPADFRRFAGHVARVELGEPLAGRRRFTGTLRGLDDSGAVKLDLPEGPVTLPFAAIERAKLELTEALLAAAKPAAGDGA
jgi:ribosome maturation factor RimP